MGTAYHQVMAEIAADRGASATAAEEYLNAAERSDDPAASRQAAEFAFDYGFDSWALRAGRRWAQLAPADRPANLLVARLLLRRDDVAGAARHAVIALGPAAARTDADYENFAALLAGEDNREGVVRLLSRLVANSPPSPALSLALGTAALTLRDAALAEASARQVLALVPAADPSADEAHALLARAALARGDRAGAIELLAARRAAGVSPDIELEYAGRVAPADAEGEAAGLVESLASRLPDDPRVRRLRGAIRLAEEDLKGAFEDYRSLLDDARYGDEAAFRLAEISIRQQQYEQAVQLLARIGDGEYLLPAQDGLARLAEAGRESEAAERLWQRVSERYPKRAFAAEAYRVQLLQRLGRDDDALKSLTRTLYYRPDDVAAWLARGAILDRLGRTDEALADMREALRLRPHAPLTLNALGYTISNRTARQQEALALIRRALEREPASGAISDSYGWVLFKLNRLPEARSYLHYAYSLLPDPEVAAHLGEVMWRQGEREAAQALWSEALERDPDSLPLKETMERFLPTPS